MRLQISEKAAAWYKNEMALHEGDHVRFFARYGGFSTVQPGFSLGVSTDLPEKAGAETIANGIHFYVEKDDLWYFDDCDFYVDFDTELGEPEFKVRN